MADLAYGKDVMIQPHGHDKYGRILADVLLSDGTNVNLSLVKDGWCWWYRKYAPGDTVLEGLEKDAREAKKGLWLTRSWCHHGSEPEQSFDLLERLGGIIEMGQRVAKGTTH